MGYATEQRQAFSDALLEVDAGAPTLCAGWTAYDLAAHCWVRERRVKALLGIGSKRFEHLAEAEMARAREQYGYVELASRLRETPRTPITLIPGGDDSVNSVEYLIHTEDVRRANALPRRVIDAGFEEVLWRRLPLMGRMFFAKAPDGVLLERSDADAPLVRAKAGESTVTIIGRPSELVLFAFGRQSAADVRLVGEPSSMDALKRAKLGA
jgi:uncharacterized protein (TIGR03085 family)